jgi:hypothetical protein
MEDAMKKITNRFLVEDADGRLFTVMCIKEYEGSNSFGSTMREVGTAFQTTSGELLTTSDNFSFNIANTKHYLRRVDVERSAQGVLRFRSFSLGM